MLFLKMCTAIAAVLISTHSFAEEPSELVEKGKKLSLEHCSRCHVVDPSKPFSGISSTPSFSLLVNALDDWEERFSSFQVRLPHPSIIRMEDEKADPDVEDLRPPIELKYDDIEALVAYARSLIKPE